MALDGEEGVGTEVQLLPKQVGAIFKKDLIWKQTQGYFSTLDLTQTFDFIDLLTPQPHFLVFKR